jgi:rare lipoprotein A
MGRAWGAGSGRLACVMALALVASALAACSTSEPFRALTSPLASTPALPASAHRPPNDLEPIAKGGGNFKIGRPYELNGRTYVPAEDPNYRTEGIASWYGPDFHGKPTANGETFDMNGISAAHPTLPMPSYLRVTNLANGRSLIVRINDRGPYARERVTDLSVGAAKALGFYDQGLARVRIEYVGRAPLGGSDDRMLLATLRHGIPAPTPHCHRTMKRRLGVAIARWQLARHPPRRHSGRWLPLAASRDRWSGHRTQASLPLRMAWPAGVASTD